MIFELRFTKMKLINQIKQAFLGRKCPLLVVLSNHPNTFEYEEAKHFESRDWRDLTCAELIQFDTINFITPEAFCYFLLDLLVFK